MQKKKLTSFINKYYLSGTVNSVILNSKSNKISAMFISGDKTLLGVLEMDKWPFEDAEVGIYSTDQLLKLLAVMDEDINMSITKSGDKSISLKLTDSVSAVDYMLSDTSIISKPPALKSLPENFELKINMTPAVMGKFVKGKGALTETDNFTIITDGDNTKMVIGHASINTNRITIPVTTSEASNIDNITFNANIFKEVLSANSECESATLEVSSAGLSKITFNVDDTSVTYYLVSVQDVD
jgi:hypothetical protein|tara:strand:+ start:3050 stop:3772 length:723 start_codon:yes stop_codon:yes gene_type:complete